MPRATVLHRGVKRSGRGTRLPLHVEPMLSTLASALPLDSSRYAFEWKWDGVRALMYLKNHTLRIESRNLFDITHQYPELHELAKVLRCRTAVLDGEIIALDDAGMPSFARLQRRMHIASPATAIRLAGEVPAWYMLFDLLFLNGKSLMGLPYHERRAQLERLVPKGAQWRVPGNVVGDGEEILKAASEASMEGIVAKSLDSIYEPGRRSPSWLKIKIIQGQEFIVGGYVPERTGRSERIGSLLLGYYNHAGHLCYAGRVGTGLSGPDHMPLLARLEPHRRSINPFATDPSTLKLGRWGKPLGEVQYVNPQVVVQIEFRRWPDGGLVQQGAFKGVRADKNPRSVVKERAVRKPQ